MSLGDRITELRTAAGMSQGQLASLMEVSRQAVSKWETGTSLPDAGNLIRLSEILDTDIEYLTTGRRTYGRRPPVVIRTTETVEKVVEKPVVQVVEKIVERVVEKPVPVETVVERPIIRRVHHTKILRNPLEFAIVGFVCFLLGLAIGYVL